MGTISKNFSYHEFEHSDIAKEERITNVITSALVRDSIKCLVDNLHRLELRYGLAACEKNEYCDKYTLQWNYPIIWSFFQYITPKGLDRYGYKEKAKEILGEVTYSRDILELIARICIKLDVDGHRADIVMLKTAITLTAYHGKKTVEKEEVMEAARLVLPHRMRRRPFEESQFDLSELVKFMEEQN